ncbi:MAG: flagellar FliJ family protein [Holosporales bacterium]|jgi:flagellar export protein FliJ|nr:flagellar FliJ family protein [Holosporales bacterium]
MTKSTLKTLTHIKKNDLDLLRQQIAQLEQQVVRLEELADILEKNRSKELAFSQSSPDYAFALEAYLEVNKQQKTKIAIGIKQLQRNITRLQEQLLDAFGEEKRYEILQEHQAENERTHLMQQETQELDEIGLTQWERHWPSPSAPSSE